MATGPRSNDEHDRQEDHDEVREAGPVDHGNDGGMATRENAPEVAEGSED